MPDPSRPCDLTPEPVDLGWRLPHFRDALKSQRKIKIVAVGSSSTAGVDPVLPFPPRLEMLMRQEYYGRMIDVLNRGIGGQEAPEELSRFESDVIGEEPALVIWQVGTNAVYRKEDYNFKDVASAIAVGLDWLADLPTDVVLMNLQFTWALTKPDKLGLSNELVSLISTTAEEKGVKVFDRFALMRRWVEAGIPIEELDDGADIRLHTSDCATKCVAKALFGAIKLAAATDAIS